MLNLKCCHRLSCIRHLWTTKRPRGKKRKIVATCLIALQAMNNSTNWSKFSLKETNWGVWLAETKLRAYLYTWLLGISSGSHQISWVHSSSNWFLEVKCACAKCVGGDMACNGIVCNNSSVIMIRGIQQVLSSVILIVIYSQFRNDS